MFPHLWLYEDHFIGFEDAYRRVAEVINLRKAKVPVASQSVKAKTTLETANQNRDYRIFEDFAFYMMKEACEKRATNILDIPGPGVEPAAAEPLLREYYCSRNLICCVCQSIDSTMAMDSTLYPSARSVAPPFCWPFSIAMPIPMTSPPAW